MVNLFILQVHESTIGLDYNMLNTMTLKREEKIYVIESLVEIWAS